MALFFGSQKVSPVIGISTSSGGTQTSGVSYAAGVVTTDVDGYATLPVLSFTPKLIVLHSSFEALEVFENGYTAYGGVLLTYFYDSNCGWVATIIGNNESGTLALANVSATAVEEGIVTNVNGAYKLKCIRYQTDATITNNKYFDISNAALYYKAYA